MSLLSFHKMNQINDAIDRYCRTSSGKSALLNMSTHEFKYIMLDMIDVNSKIFNDIVMNYILLHSAIRMRHYDDAEKYYYTLYLAKLVNDNVGEYKPKIEEIEIASPRVYINPIRLFKIDEDEN